MRGNMLVLWPHGCWSLPSRCWILAGCRAWPSPSLTQSVMGCTCGTDQACLQCGHGTACMVMLEWLEWLECVPMVSQWFPCQVSGDLPKSSTSGTRAEPWPGFCWLHDLAFVKALTGARASCNDRFDDAIAAVPVFDRSGGKSVLEPSCPCEPVSGHLPPNMSLQACAIYARPAAYCYLPVTNYWLVGSVNWCRLRRVDVVDYGRHATLLVA